MMMFINIMPMHVFACLYVTKCEHFLALSVFLFVCYVLSFLWPSDDDDEDEAGDGARDCQGLFTSVVPSKDQANLQPDTGTNHLVKSTTLLLHLLLHCLRLELLKNLESD